MSPNKVAAYAVGILLPTLATITTGLRLLAKSRVKRGLALDDAFIVAGLLLVWVMTGIYLAGTVGSAVGGKSAYDAQTHTYVEETPQGYLMERLQWAFLLAERLAFPTIKISVVLWYRTIFVGVFFKRFTSGLLVFLALWGIAFFFSSLFECGPSPAVRWSSLVEAIEKCDKTELQQVIFTIIDTATDLVIVVLPMPYLYGLQLSLPKRINLIFIFSLAGVMFVLVQTNPWQRQLNSSTAAAIVKMAMWIKWAYLEDPALSNFLADATIGLTWSLVSAGTGVIAACLLTLRPLASVSVIDSLWQSARRRMRSKLSVNRLFHRSTPDIEEAASEYTTSKAVDNI